MDSHIGTTTTDMIHSTITCDSVQCDILIYLPADFKREDLRILVTKSKVHNVKIIGTRPPAAGNKLSSFQFNFSISNIWDANNIIVKFTKGLLHVMLPKLIGPAEKNDEPSTTPEATKTNQEQHKTTKDEILENKEAKSTKDKRDESEQTRNDDSDQSAKNEDGYKLEAENPVTKIKRARQMRKIVVGVLYVLALGMFISSMHAWFSSQT